MTYNIIKEIIIKINSFEKNGYYTDIQDHNGLLHFKEEVKIKSVKSLICNLLLTILLVPLTLFIDYIFFVIEIFIIIFLILKKVYLKYKK